MRFWFDTEFIEDGHTIDLISIGIVSEDGREFYGVSSEFDETKANEWVRTNVFPYLLEGIETNVWYTRENLKKAIIDFVGTDTNPEFWAYYGAYDWVALCQLFGTMSQLPENFPMFYMDLKQFAKMIDVSRIPKQNTREHNALEDARWNREVWCYLVTEWIDIIDGRIG